MSTRSRPRPVARGLAALVLGAVAAPLLPVASATASPSGAPAEVSEVPAVQRVAELDGRIAAAEARLDAADRDASTAVEDVNVAREETAEARAAAAEAAAAAAKAERDLAEARRLLGAIASRTYRQGPGIEAMDALRGGDGAEGFLDRVSLLRQVGREQDAQVQRLLATAVVADVLREEATAAASRAEAAESALAAREVEARARLRDATATAQQLIDERAELVASVARLRGATVRAEQARQDDLSATRAQAAGDVTTTAVPATAAQDRPVDGDAWRVDGPGAALPGPVPSTPVPSTREQRPDAPSLPVPAPAPAPVPSTSAPAPRPPATPTPSTAAPPVPTPAPPPPSTQGTPSTSAAAGAEAVAWARTQLGKAYLWGGSGPDAYDCSGLTMRAWQRGGVSLPHSSRLQYQRVARVPRDRIRPGDLIFWASNTADASTIHHVAVYSGGGMMIEAPNSRNVVREVPVRWAGTMAMVGRP